MRSDKLLYNMALATMTKEALSSELLQYGLPAAAGALGLGLMGPRTGGKLDRGALLKNMLVGGGLGLGGAALAPHLKELLMAKAMGAPGADTHLPMSGMPMQPIEALQGHPSELNPPGPHVGDPDFVGPVSRGPSVGDLDFVGPDRAPSLVQQLLGKGLDISGKGVDKLQAMSSASASAPLGSIGVAPSMDSSPSMRAPASGDITESQILENFVRRMNSFPGAFPAGSGMGSAGVSSRG